MALKQDSPNNPKILGDKSPTTNGKPHELIFARIDFKAGKISKRRI